jgi:hypothetical protein
VSDAAWPRWERVMRQAPLWISKVAGYPKTVPFVVLGAFFRAFFLLVKHLSEEGCCQNFPTFGLSRFSGGSKIGGENF